MSAEIHISFLTVLRQVRLMDNVMQLLGGEKQRVLSARCKKDIQYKKTETRNCYRLYKSAYIGNLTGFNLDRLPNYSPVYLIVTQSILSSTDISSNCTLLDLFCILVQ